MILLGPKLCEPWVLLRFTRWWQLKSFLFSSRSLGKCSNLTIIFFKWVGSITNWFVVMNLQLLGSLYHKFTGFYTSLAFQFPKRVLESVGKNHRHLLFLWRVPSGPPWKSKWRICTASLISPFFRPREVVVCWNIWKFQQKLNGTESQRTPFSKLRSSYEILRFRGPFSGSCWIFLGKIHGRIPTQQGKKDTRRWKVDHFFENIFFFRKKGRLR